MLFGRGVEFLQHDCKSFCGICLGLSWAGLALCLRHGSAYTVQAGQGAVLHKSIF